MGERVGGRRPHADRPLTVAARVRILLVDDQALVRSGFRLILENEDDFEVVGEAGDGAQAIELAADLHPDIVLMDVRMPRMDGVEATRELCRSGANRVLILTTFDLDEYLYAAVRAGASGFLLKDVPPDDLVNAVRTIARGDALIEPRMTRRLLEEFARSPAPPAGAGTAAEAAGAGVADPTQREVEVFAEMARGLSNAEIAAALYISEATVKTHVAHILTKLGCRDRIQAVVLAYEGGYVQPGAAR